MFKGVSVIRKTTLILIQLMNIYLRTKTIYVHVLRLPLQEIIKEAEACSESTRMT